MALKAVPIDMITAPNFYSVLPNNRWEIVSPNAQALWFQLCIVDAMGQRPYVPAVGSSMVVTFQRADLISLTNTPPPTLTNTSRNVVKTALIDSNNRSLMKLDMTTQNIQDIVSGTAKFTLTEGSNTTVFLANWSVYKKLTEPGF
jgi:hypothetical protein